MKQLTLILALLLICTAGGRKKERIETPQAGAVLQMGFNEGAGAKDWSNFGNDGTVVGATINNANGYSGAGCGFDVVGAEDGAAHGNADVGAVGRAANIGDSLRPDSPQWPQG